MQNNSFEDIYRELFPKIHRYMNRLVGPENADDLTQEVFIRAFRNLNSFIGRSSLSTWFYRIAGNIATDWYRSATFRNTKNEASLQLREEFGLDSAIATYSIDSSADEDMLQCIREFINSLPESYRTAFVLHELEGYSNAETAEILEVSIPTAKIRIHRGKERLKKKMENGCCLYYDESNRLSCSRKT
jgi:RNA polymerase sigma-70 factor, ECF subfamily